MWAADGDSASAKVVFDGEVRDMILVDAEGDGRHNGEEDRWIALKDDRSTMRQ